MSIHHLFFPRTVAVVGSVSEGKLGYELVRQMLEGGYSNLFAVNPKGLGAFSIRGYVSLTAIDRTIDTVVIATPSSAVAPVLEECGHIGVRTAIIISAGFSESGDDSGEQRIKEIAEHHHIRFIGPNCAGLVNTKHNFFPTLESRPPAGRIGLITQSGAVGGLFLGSAVEEGLGISKFVNYGNGTDLNEIELLDYFREDLDTEVICSLHREHIRRPAVYGGCPRLFPVKTVDCFEIGTHPIGTTSRAIPHGGPRGSGCNL